MLGQGGGGDRPTSRRNLQSALLHENLDQKKRINPHHEREDGERKKKRGKLEKTAEGVNNSCRQYDFFM